MISRKPRLAIKLEDIEAARARQRQLAGLRINNSKIETQTESPLASIDAKVSSEVKGKTTFIVSKKAGISLATYERVKDYNNEWK